ncbi:molybdopterin-guanine dinucleotide biosynthesis protein B [Desulfotruncus alcoholivorax]|uniref:molybdopterin-guanine dinucleotide biosynthesis protein B n=1 Tax=Desulfotruncus alcoholivorax TaxID=265477 RepID=UPI000401506D|nr:molybdopterin-guanine dinucleotide biosynthesis protein B [Desulfotruncus alcoholivorax]
MSGHSVPVISVVGWSNSGKTTFLEKLVAELKARGIKVGIIKHHHGPFEIDRPGKDTWRLFQAGAECTAIAGPGKVGLVIRSEEDMPPGDIAALMPGVDLVITEGYKGSAYPQIEVRRAGHYRGETTSRVGRLVAVIGDLALCEEGFPCFSSEDIAGAADFIIDQYCRGSD